MLRPVRLNPTVPGANAYVEAMIPERFYEATMRALRRRGYSLIEAKTAHLGVPVLIVLSPGPEVDLEAAEKIIEDIRLGR